MKTTTQNNLVRFLMLSCAAATVLNALPQSARADVEVYRKTLNSTVWVLAKKNGETSSGTGVLVDDEKRLVVTNYHVVGDARTAVIFFPDFKDDQPIVEQSHYLTNVRKLGIRGRIIGVDRKRDLALVELSKLPDGVSAIKLASEPIGAGEDVQSVGNPGKDALWVFTSGTVRSVYQKEFRTGAGEHDFKVVETQSPINAGDSGGPVVNNRGELVAISQAISPKARLVSYSVDLSEVKYFLENPWKPAPLPIQDVLEASELEFTKHESGHFIVEFDQKDETKQAVFVTNDVEYYERADIRKVWALAATLPEAPSLETSMRLLQQSARTKIGAWSIEKTEDGQYMVVYVVKLDATASPTALRSTMEYVAKLTSVSKKDLTPSETTSEEPTDTLASWLQD